MTRLPRALTLLLVLATGLLGCGGPTGRHTPEEYLKIARQHEQPVTTALELFRKTAPFEDWQAAFESAGDSDLYEAYAYRQLLRDNPDATVEETLNRVANLRVKDPFIRFMQAQRLMRDAARVRQDQAQRLEDSAAVIRDYLREAAALEPDNAFWYYQEATFWFQMNDPDNAWIALEQGNRAKSYQHPFASPLPREISEIEQLPELMGSNMGAFFQTNPRMFLTQFLAELQEAGSGSTKDPVAAERVLLAARKQLVMIPFDLPSYQGALGINRTLWEQAKQAGVEGADEVLEAIAAYEEPTKESTAAIEAAQRQLKSQDSDANLLFAATMVAQTVNYRENTAPLHKRLLAVIDKHLPVAGASTK